MKKLVGFQPGEDPRPGRDHLYVIVKPSQRLVSIFTGQTGGVMRSVILVTSAPAATAGHCFRIFTPTSPTPSHWSLVFQDYSCKRLIGDVFTIQGVGVLWRKNNFPLIKNNLRHYFYFLPFRTIQEAYKGEIQCPNLPNQICFWTNQSKFHAADLQLLLLSSNQNTEVHRK